MERPEPGKEEAGQSRGQRAETEKEERGETMSQSALNRILESRIIAIVRGVYGAETAELAKALKRGGVSCIELTFDQSSEEKAEETLRAIRQLRKDFGEELCVGAGTVMTEEQVRRAAEAGAEYMISPNVDAAVIRETKRLGKLSIPGAMTPTEVAYARSCGADIVKLFPAGVLGAAYVRAVKAPLRHIPITAVGNVTVENCAELMRAGAAGVGVGGNLVSPKLVGEGRFDEISDIARAYVRALHF